jgi:hypothetical protein
MACLFSHVYSIIKTKGKTAEKKTPVASLLPVFLWLVTGDFPAFVVK